MPRPSHSSRFYRPKNSTSSLRLSSVLFISCQRQGSSRCSVKYCKLLVQTSWWWKIIWSKHIEDRVGEINYFKKMFIVLVLFTYVSRCTVRGMWSVCTYVTFHIAWSNTTHLLRRKLKADWIQGMLAIIRWRNFCLLVF
jgi:hypothetical protein